MPVSACIHHSGSVVVSLLLHEHYCCCSCGCAEPAAKFSGDGPEAAVLLLCP